jgi:hypothetical protein
MMADLTSMSVLIKLGGCIYTRGGETSVAAARRVCRRFADS